MNTTRRIIVLSLFFCFALGSALGQGSAEATALQKILDKHSRGGSVNFSDLYNSPDFNAEEKAFLGRLYEIFFAIPGFLKEHHQATGGIASRDTMASNFGVSTHSVDLLLKVMESDSRVPSLFQRDPQTKEIVSLNFDDINRFLSSRGAEVKITDWKGKPLPEFSLITLRGEPFSKQHLEGEKVLLYFWFTGCPPCVRIAPILAELDRKYPEVTFVGINADEVLEMNTTDASRLEYLGKQGIEFTNLNLTEEARNAFGNINVYPTIFLADEEATIVEHLLNYQPQETLEQLLDNMTGR